MNKDMLAECQGELTEHAEFFRQLGEWIIGNPLAPEDVRQFAMDMLDELAEAEARKIN